MSRNAIIALCCHWPSEIVRLYLIRAQFILFYQIYLFSSLFLPCFYSNPELWLTDITTGIITGNTTTCNIGLPVIQLVLQSVLQLTVISTYGY